MLSWLCLKSVTMMSAWVINEYAICWSKVQSMFQCIYTSDSEKFEGILARVLTVRSCEWYKYLIWNSVDSTSYNLWTKRQLTCNWVQQSPFQCSLVRWLFRSSNKKKWNINSHHKLLACSSHGDSSVQNNVILECFHTLPLMDVWFQKGDHQCIPCILCYDHLSS